MANTGAMASVVMRVMASCVSIGERAGRIIRDVVKSGELGIVDKTATSSIDDNKEFDPQTEADRTAQMVIVGSLKNQYPDLVVLGEEEGCERPDDDKLLVLDMDPLVLQQECPKQYEKLTMSDGHLHHVTVLIGVAAQGNAIGGVICQPFFDTGIKGASPGRNIWGIVGLGIFGIDLASPPSGRRIITTTKSHSNKTVLEAVKAMNPDEVLRVGGSGYKVLQVLEGTADAYVYASPGTKKWDSCAPEAVLRAAGGTFTDIYGSTIQYQSDVKVKNLGGLLVSMTDHSYYVSRVPQSVKDSLTPQ